MRKFFITLFVITLVFGVAGMTDVFALNITIYDENSDSAPWYGTAEDQEVEPGMLTGQEWDLEAFLYEGTTLSMVGGYDFVNGEWGNGRLWKFGDIFIDVNGDLEYGDIHGSSDGNHVVQDTFGYDYVLDLDFEHLTYDLYQLIPEESTTITAYFKDMQGSNPWRYADGGELLGSGYSFSYETSLSDADVGFLGGTHNLVSGFDLSFLGGRKFFAHFTYECGNDNLMGDPEGARLTDPVPEPGTLVLLGSGLLIIIGIVRKHRS